MSISTSPPKPIQNSIKNDRSCLLRLTALTTLVLLFGCNGGSSDGNNGGSSNSTDSNSGSSQAVTPSAFNLTSVASVTGKAKTLSINWESSQGATNYVVCKKEQNNCLKLAPETTETQHTVELDNTFMSESDEFYVIAKNTNHNTQTASNELPLPDTSYKSAVGYFKASNVNSNDGFGASGAMSLDGKTMIISAPQEKSNSQADESNNSLTESGAAYLFKKIMGSWTQTQYIKSSDTPTDRQRFGINTQISDSGDIAVISSSSKFYILENGVHKTSFAFPSNSYNEVALSGDGNTLFVSGEGRNAVDVYERSKTDGSWSRTSTIFNPSTDNPAVSIRDMFSVHIATNRDGSMVVIGAAGEDSNSNEVNGDASNDLKSDSGAAYVFKKDNGVWVKHAYLKPKVSGVRDNFGQRVYLHPELDYILVASSEDSNATGVNGDATDNSTEGACSAYLFAPHPTSGYVQIGYLKSNAPQPYSEFAMSMSMSEDATLVAVNEPNNGTANFEGVVHLYKVAPNNTVTYFKTLKSPNSDGEDWFGSFVTFANQSLLVGATGEASSSNTVQQGQDKDDMPQAGAAYLF